MSYLDYLTEKWTKPSRPVLFREVKQVCDQLFGEPRVRGSHHIYRTPWQGDPRINIQNRRGYVAAYQVKQVLKAVARMEEDNG